MMGKPQPVPVETIQDEMDEGWWAAVLADEESSTDELSDSMSFPGRQTELVLVDWERVKSVYENDEIIELQVYGYNRGGLLVQNHGIQGFVPVSHLVDMPCGLDEETRKKRYLNISAVP